MREQAIKRYKIASIIMIIHGAVMEVGGCLCILPIIFFKSDTLINDNAISFVVPYFNDHLFLACLAGTIYGFVRIIGAIGLRKNKMWGFVQSVINCVITLALMMFMLPAGIIDGILAGVALILILQAYFGDKEIT